MELESERPLGKVMEVFGGSEEVLLLSVAQRNLSAI